MLVVYVGPSRAPVEIPAAGVTCQPGKPCEVPDDIARGLLEQKDAWRRASKPRAKE